MFVPYFPLKGCEQRLGMLAGLSFKPYTQLTGFKGVDENKREEFKSPAKVSSEEHKLWQMAQKCRVLLIWLLPSFHSK